MPEAPEVAVAAAQLAHVAVGREVTGLDVTHPRTSRAQPASALDTFVGRRVQAVERIGKWLVVEFSGVDTTLGIHLRMSGQLLARDVDAQPVDRHVHAVIGLGSRPQPVPAVRAVRPPLQPPVRPPGAPGAPGAPDAPGPPAGAAGATASACAVHFRDPRTFGELRLFHGRPPVAADLFDARVDGPRCVEHARRRTVGVKAVLLDQTSLVAGIGSYLGDESLHAAGIRPTAPSRELTAGAWQRILDAARHIAMESTRAGGVSLADEGWVDLWGRLGGHGPRLVVHARRNCGACGAETRTAEVGGRRARWCPRCQPARRRR